MKGENHPPHAVMWGQLGEDARWQAPEEPNPCTTQCRSARPPGSGRGLLLVLVAGLVGSISPHCV